MTASAARSPQWRNRYAVVGTPAEHTARERASLRDAICEVIGMAALTVDQILAAVHEDWGACSTAQLDSALRELERDGDAARVGGRYVVVERDDEEECE